jgi:hypothetical protein
VGGCTDQVSIVGEPVAKRTPSLIMGRIEPRVEQLSALPPVLKKLAKIYLHLERRQCPIEIWSIDLNGELSGADVDGQMTAGDHAGIMSINLDMRARLRRQYESAEREFWSQALR